MRNKKALGGTEIYIYIYDLTWTERKIRDKVREKAREIREEGKKVVIIRQKELNRRKGHGRGKRERWFLHREMKLQEEI